MPTKSYTRIGGGSSSEDEGHDQKNAAVGSIKEKPPLAGNSRTKQQPENNDYQSLASGDTTATSIFSPLVPNDELSVSVATTDASTTMGKDPSVDDSSIVEVDLTNEDQGKGKIIKIWYRLRGIIAAFLATVLIALVNQIFYYLFDEKEISCSKSLFLGWSYVIYLVENCIPLQYVMWKNMKGLTKPLKDNRKLIIYLAVRGLLGSSVQFVTSHAIDRFRKPAPVSVITAMAPIFVYVTAYFVLHEKLGVIPILNVFVAIGGVIVMNYKDLNNPGDSVAMEGTGLALTAMLLLAWVTVVVRILRDVHPVLINIAYGLGGILVQGSIVIYQNSYWCPDREVMLLCFACGTITAVSNYLFNLALKYESAGVVSLLRTTEVLLSFLFQYMFFNINLDLYTALGGGMILFGVICVTFRKIVMESSETGKLRKYFWFLLY